MSTSPSSFAWRSVSCQGDWPAFAAAATRAAPASPASALSPRPVAIRSLRNASSAQYCRTMLTRRLSVAAPAVMTAAAWSLSSVPEKSPRLIGSSIRFTSAGAGHRGGGKRALVDRLGPFGELAEAGETAHQDPAHEAARGDDVRIGQPIPDLPSVAFGLHDPGGPHDCEMLGDVRLADPHLVCQAADFLRLVGEEVEDLEPAGACENLHDLRLEAPDRVHGEIIHPCACLLYTSPSP